MYCGHTLGRAKKGEHVIPRALGGALALKQVCPRCNNRFSEIDGELCSRSPLSIIASQEIDSHVWQVWDVDDSSGNVLLEARPEWAGTRLKSLVQYPQLVLERGGLVVRGDAEEMRHFGDDNFNRLLVRSLLDAFQRNKAGERRWLHFEHIEPNATMRRHYRFPPRIFWRHSIGELRKRFVQKKPAAFVLRYACDADRRRLLSVLDNWNPTLAFRHLKIGMGSHRPEIRFLYEITKTLRGLAKVALNVLAKCCQQTPVDAQHFPDAVAIILGQSPTAMLQGGFVRPSEIESIGRQHSAHSFRLVHMDGHWHIYSSFFGGRAGSFMRFNGPNYERWRTMDVEAPLRSAGWLYRRSRILQPLSCHFGIFGASEIIPSVEFLRLNSELRLLVGR